MKVVAETQPVIQERRRFSLRGRRFGATSAALLGSTLFCPPATAGQWHWTAALETAQPTGWVQVRENAIEGTRLHFGDDSASIVGTALGWTPRKR
jgi:hypothetical protein